ncbi:single-stranded DNA-binding protein [Fimbriiglobus ruber]|uniref:Single-stranded DNA-binding protein n=1 Tax=Fimbriiglobus ruber TaxID=1908690 RepID=A0A225DIE5_9BACT|nr:single-stranded DNA-binding protein [Fimbriiglobus ruber]OWK40763.1 Single-stranded DNA-binding protein [Fimbriiglobus ruber]
MANLNKVILIGRLTRDPETRAFANGGMVASFGFAVTNRRKNSQTGQWEDDPMFIDAEAFNRGEFGKLADIVRDRCRKGSQVMIEGKLHLDRWDDKTTGQKRSKHKIVVDNLQLLDPRTGGGTRWAGVAAATKRWTPRRDRPPTAGRSARPRRPGGVGRPSNRTITATRATSRFNSEDPARAGHKLPTRGYS